MLFGRTGGKKITPQKAAETLSDVATLQNRGNQAQAAAWAAELEAAGLSADTARSLTRWIGIESSGDPRAMSKLGERGLLQIMPATAKEALTAADWQALVDPSTSRAAHAAIAARQFKWHREKAKKYVKPWPGDATFDAMFYSKLHHARPKDLSDNQKNFSGTAAKDARFLTSKWKNDAAALKRLAAASVVAWGTITPP